MKHLLGLIVICMVIFTFACGGGDSSPATCEEQCSGQAAECDLLCFASKQAYDTCKKVCEDSGAQDCAHCNGALDEYLQCMGDNCGFYFECIETCQSASEDGVSPLDTPFDTPDTAQEDTVDPDSGFVLPDSKEHDTVDSAVFFDTDVETDVPLDTYPEEDTPVIPSGATGADCEGAQDCTSGICLEANPGNKCSEVCDGLTPCPLNWHCGSLPGSLDMVCLPTMTKLCRPCTSNMDCYSNGVDVGDRCVSLGGGGSFCGGVCNGGVECGAGYSCHGMVDQGGSPSDQCVPDDSTCACSDKDITEGAWTYCYNQNLFGECHGERFCSSNGLTECTALVPSEDVCNGIDDNCDGEIDEGALDTDDDGIPNCLDEDDDGDNIADYSDLCPLHPDGGEDLDGDGVGDACDPDIDGDEDPNTTDCAPNDPTIGHGKEELCDGIDNDCVGGVPSDETDNDGDGIRGCEGDCNDNNASVFPGATENCNTSYDDDCDDDPNGPDPLNCTIYYRDDDQDNYGSMDSLCICAPTPPYTAVNASDCDDTDPEVNPLGVEDCLTDADDNCDGHTDDPGALNCSPFYLDADQDGYGSPNSVCSCGPLEFYTADNVLDCNDNNWEVNPDMAEDCLTDYDDNCNGTANDVDSDNCVLFYEDSDGDDFGTGPAVCICQPQAIYTAANPDDCDDTNPLIFPGAPENCATDYDDNCNFDNDEPDSLGCQDFWVDQDGDGFAGTAQCRCEQPPGSMEFPEDCCDQDADAHPGQQAFFDHAVSVCGGWDYNCDQVEELEKSASCVEGDCGGLGWFQSTPACGEQANWCMNCNQCEVCTGAIIQQTQQCR